MLFTPSKILANTAPAVITANAPAAAPSGSLPRRECSGTNHWFDKKDRQKVVEDNPDRVGS